MRAALILLPVLVACTHRSPAPPDPGWVVSTAAGPDLQGGNDLALDSEENLLVTGSFYGALQLGGTTLTSRGHEDLFVAKIAPDGRSLWALSGGGASRDVARAIAVDREGNAFITGDFMESAAFGGTTLQAQALTDSCFIAKVSGSGTFLWARAIQGRCQGRDLAVDEDGNALVTGAYQLRAVIGQITLTSPNHFSDLFVAKFSAEGQVLWALSSAGAAKHVIGDSIAVDATGNAFVSGSCYTMSLGPYTVTAERRDRFVARLSPAGEVQWVRVAGGDADIQSDIAVDLAGTIFLHSHLTGQELFGSTYSTDARSRRRTSVLAKLDPTGRPVWVTRSHVEPEVDGFSVSYENGGLATDASGNVYLAGVFHESASFGDHTLHGAGICGDSAKEDMIPDYPCEEVFVAKYDGQGTPRWAVSGGGPLADAANGLAVSEGGQAIVTGSFRGSATFGDVRLEGAGVSSYIWKLPLP